MRILRVTGHERRDKREIRGSEAIADGGLESLGVFKKLFEEWFREIGSTFSYHRAYHPCLGNVPVFLCGGGACLPNLAPFLGQLLGTPTERPDIQDVLDVQGPAPPDRRERLGLAAVAGEGFSFGASPDDLRAGLRAQVGGEVYVRQKYSPSGNSGPGGQFGLFGSGC